MPQIIINQRKAHLASYTFLQEILINIKTRQSHSSINHLEHVFSQDTYHQLISSFEYCRVFKNNFFLQNTSISSRLRMFFQIGVLKSFTNFTGMHLCWSLFLKKLQAGSFIKKTPTQVFSCDAYKMFKKTFSYRTTPVAASVFFLKKYY